MDLETTNGKDVKHMDNAIITELEGLTILKEAGLSEGEEKLTAYYKKNGYINSDKSLEAYLEKLEQIYTYAKLIINPKSAKGNPFSGKKRLIELGEKRDEIIERVDNRKGNGYQATENEIMMQRLIYNELLTKREMLDSYPHGMSHSGWATFLGIRQIDESESFEIQAIEHLESCYSMKSNEYFKPKEIVIEFQRAFMNTRKTVPVRAFDNLVKEGKITTEDFYIAGIPNDKKKNSDDITFVVIPHEQYEDMKTKRKEILEENGSSLSEYFGNMKKKKSDKMKAVYKAVSDGLLEEFGATRFHKSIKVELINVDEDDTPNFFNNINSYFIKHFVERSITYRHGNKDYKTSTFFWRRFYYLSTCYLLRFIEEGYGIDKILYHREIDNFQANLQAYRYDFKGYEFGKETVGEGYFGNHAEEIKRKQDEWLVMSQKTISTEEVQALFDDIKEEAEPELSELEEIKQKISALPKSSSFEDENLWMERQSLYAKKSKLERAIADEPVVKQVDAPKVDFNPTIKPKGWIDIGTLAVSPVPETKKKRKNQIFGLHMVRENNREFAFS